MFASFLRRAVGRVAGVLLVPLALALPHQTAAQELRFGSLPWGAPPDTVRAHLRAAGYQWYGAARNGDLLFTGPDSVQVDVVMRAGSAVGVWLRRPLPEPALEARFTVLADSFRTMLGVENVSHPPRGVGWQRGLTHVGVWKLGEGGARALVVEYRGPGYVEELARRPGAPGHPYPELQPEWVVIGMMSDGRRFAIDTASITRRGEGVYRAQVRWDHTEVVPDPSGAWDTLIYGSDFDCPRERMQLRSRTALRQGRRVRHDAGATVWVPAGPETEKGWELQTVCGFVAGRAPPAPPG